MRKNIITGFLVLLPLLITYTIIAFLFKIITNPFENLIYALINRVNQFTDQPWIFTQEKVIYFISSLCVIVALVAFIIFVGIVGRWVIFQSLIYFSDAMILKIPIISKVYAVCKEITETIFSQKSASFKQAALVPYPSKNERTIGLVTGEFTDINGELFVSAVIPGAPNPTVGFLCTFPKKSVVFLDLKVDDALKYIMSCGSSIPENDPHFQSIEIRR